MSIGTSSEIKFLSFRNKVTTFDGLRTQPGLVSACVTYTLNGLNVTKIR